MALPSRRICEGDDDPPPPLLPPPPPPPPPPPQPPPPLRSALKRENMLIHGIRCVRYLDAQKRRRTIEVTNILVRSVLTMRQLFSRKVRRQKKATAGAVAAIPWRSRIRKETKPHNELGKPSRIETPAAGGSTLINWNLPPHTHTHAHKMIWCWYFQLRTNNMSITTNCDSTCLARTQKRRKERIVFIKGKIRFHLQMIIWPVRKRAQAASDLLWSIHHADGEKEEKGRGRKNYFSNVLAIDRPLDDDDTIKTQFFHSANEWQGPRAIINIPAKYLIFHSFG